MTAIATIASMTLAVSSCEKENEQVLQPAICDVAARVTSDNGILHFADDDVFFELIYLLEK